MTEEQARAILFTPEFQLLAKATCSLKGHTKLTATKHTDHWCFECLRCGMHKHVRKNGDTL